jgi:DNA polymerase I-like protein with 3'-5' exonuclease and polymerase domains
MTNEALINIYYNIKPLMRLDILLQVHDQLVMQVHKDDLTWEKIQAIEKEMSIEITIGLDTFTIPVDMSMGFNWYELAEIENEDDYNKWRKENKI